MKRTGSLKEEAKSFRLDQNDSSGRSRADLLASALEDCDLSELAIKTGITEASLKKYRQGAPQKKINHETLERILGVIGTPPLLEAFGYTADRLQFQTTVLHLQGLIDSKTEIIFLLSQKPLELESQDPALLSLLVKAVRQGLTLVYWFCPEVAHKFAKLHGRMQEELRKGRSELEADSTRGKVLFVCGPPEACWITVEIAFARASSLALRVSGEIRGVYRLANQSWLLQPLPDDNINRILPTIVPIYSHLSADAREFLGYRLLHVLA